MTTKYIIASRNSELYHWGIKDMHWGDRRFQYKDGSLTPEGKKRYLKGTKKKDTKKTSTTDKKPISEMTKKQIEKETERLKALQQYNELQRSEQISRMELQKKADDLVRAGQQADIDYKTKLMTLSQKEYDDKNYTRDSDLKYRKELADVRSKEIKNKIDGESWLKKNLKSAGSIAVANITNAVTKKAGEKIAEKLFGDKDAFKDDTTKSAVKQVATATAGATKKVVNATVDATKKAAKEVKLDQTFQKSGIKESTYKEWFNDPFEQALKKKDKEPKVEKASSWLGSSSILGTSMTNALKGVNVDYSTYGEEYKKFTKYDDYKFK